MKRLWYWVSVFGGSGLSPKAPGTAGSLASLLIWAPLVLLDVSWVWRLVLVVFVFFIGTYAISKSLSYYHDDDPKEVVIDEVAGQGLALLLCGPSILTIIAGFLLFRFFDIVKPWPVGWVDQKLKGPWGIMLDDIVAGIYALIVLVIYAQFT